MLEREKRFCSGKKKFNMDPKKVRSGGVSDDDDDEEDVCFQREMMRAVEHQSVQRLATHTHTHCMRG